MILKSFKFYQRKQTTYVWPGTGTYLWPTLDEFLIVIGYWRALGSYSSVCCISQCCGSVTFWCRLGSGPPQIRTSD
jgi:hypothetical protein